MLRRLLLSLLAGGALCLAFPAYDIWVLAPVGVALLALATRGAGARRGAAAGLVAGLVFFTVSLRWSGVYVGVLPWVALAVLQALFMALLGGVCGWLQSPRQGPGAGGSARVRPLVVALAWVGQEALRDRVPYGGFPWVRLAFSQAGSPLAHLAALAGAPAVTFGVGLSGGLLAVAVCRFREGWRPAALPLTGALLAAVGGLLVPLPTDGTSTRVMAVQGNVARAGLDFNAERRQVLDNHVDATIQAAAEVDAGTRQHPDLVVWPENASDIDPLRNADAATQITRALDAVRAPLVLGALLEQPLPEVSNAALLYRPGAGLTDRYVKQHPVPFAEYIPNRSFFRLFSDKVDLVRADFAAGDRPAVFTVPNAAGGEIHAGPSICFEVAYDVLVRDSVRLGANLLLVQTNNATFGFTDESVQQLAISRIRAVEHGRSVVHVSTVGVSALITPDGTAHQGSTLFTRAVLSGELPLRTATTVATVVGPWPEYAACLALVCLLLVRVRRPRRVRPAEPSPPDPTP